MFSGSELLVVVVVLLVVVAPVLIVVGFALISRRSRRSAALMQAAPLEAQPLPPPTADPGWYPDPTRASAQRFWNGHAWTDRAQ